jgi:hypothetical protein
MADDLKIKVNGREWPVSASPDTPLLYVLTNELRLQGPRFGCGLAQCGSCSVLADGVEIRSCVTPVSAIGEKSVTTLEGLPALYAQQKGLAQAPALPPQIPWPAPSDAPLTLPVNPPPAVYVEPTPLSEFAPGSTYNPDGSVRGGLKPRAPPPSVCAWAARGATPGTPLGHVSDAQLVRLAIHPGAPNSGSLMILQEIDRRSQLVWRCS